MFASLQHLSQALQSAVLPAIGSASSAEFGRATSGSARSAGASTIARRRATQLLILSTFLPVLLMSVSAWLTWRETWERAEVEVERSALAIAQYGERVLALHAVAAGRINGILRGLSDAEIRSREAELHAEIRRVTEEIPQTDVAFATDRHGAALVSANIFPVPRGTTPAADRDYFIELAADDHPQFHVSRVHVGRVDERQLFAISRRREKTGNHDRPGTFDGVVNLSIVPDRLSQELRELVVGAVDIAGLVRLDGEVLARSPPFAEPVRVGDDLAAALAGRPNFARIQARSVVDGHTYLVAARRIEGWPVYGMAGRPRSAITAEWRGAVAYQLAIGLPATLLLVGFAFTVRQGGRGLAGANDLLEQRVAARTAELAESERRLQRALRAGRVVALEYDTLADRVFRSPNAGELLGLPEEVAEAQSHPLTNVHPEDRANLLATLAALTPAEPAYTLRFRHVRPHGDIVWLQAEGAGTFAPDGRLLRVSSLARDITAKVEAETARRDAELRLRAATEGAGLGIYEVDFVRRMAWFDARAAGLSGGIIPAETWFSLDGPEWRGRTEAIHPEDRAAMEKAWSDTQAGERNAWVIEGRIRRPDGSWVWELCHGTVLDLDPATGCPRRLVGVVQDVTARHVLEAELRHSQKLQALGTLAGGIAHDFNNVLQAVSGIAAMIAREAADPAQVERRSRTLGEAVRRGTAITGRLLAFARRHEVQAEALDPAEILHGLKEMLAPALGSGIEIRVLAEPGLPPVRAHREQLQTALINLAINARDAMPSGGVLTLSAQAERVPPHPGGGPATLAPGTYVRLSVEDTGEGMSAATLARAAEPFFTTKPEGVGTGLGLPMAKGLARHAGGGFALASEPGKGTTVTLWLPEAGTSPAPAAEDPPDAAGETPPMRILLVDDDGLVRESLADQFRQSGHGVVTAEDAEHALALLDEGAAPDALVTDLVMPGANGLALIAEARRRRPGLPAVLLTGSAGDDPIGSRSGQEQIAPELMRKPADIGALIANLAAQLRGTPRQP